MTSLRVAMKLSMAEAKGPAAVSTKDFGEGLKDPLIGMCDELSNTT
jgi:hypothetical protein